MAELTDWSALSKPDNPEFEEWIESIGGIPDMGDAPDIPTLRQRIAKSKAAMNARVGPVITGVKEADHQAPMRDGSEITCRTYQPENPPAEGSPLAVVFHGGGWCIGGLENEELLCRLLTSKLGVTCVNVDYRLAPEYKWPTAVHDCYDATKWAAANAASLGADPSKGFVLSGTSGGGNLALVTIHLWQEAEESPRVTGYHLMAPFLCYNKYVPEKYRSEYKSWEDIKSDPIVTQKAQEFFMGSYIPSEQDRKHPTFSPWLFPSGRKSLPPSYFQVCGRDQLRDETLIFERILREEDGIKTKLDVYPGLPHIFWSRAPQLNVSKKFVDDSVKGVEWLLQQ